MRSGGTRIEQWVVAGGSAGTDDDGVHAAAQPMHHRARCGICDPLRRAGVRGDFAIPRHGPFCMDVGKTCFDELAEWRGEPAHVSLQLTSDFDGDAGLAKSGDSFSRDLGERILATDDDVANAGGDDRFRAGGRFAEVTAGFERDV